MIMAWRDRVGGHNFVFCNIVRVVGETEREWGIKIRTMWRI